MYENYDLFKFSADLQAVLYENEKLKLENEELKANLRKNQVLYDKMKFRMTNAISARKRHQNKHN